MFSCGRIDATIGPSKGVVVTDAMSSSVSSGPRNTRQRYEVVALLDEESGFRTANQLHMLLVARGAKVGLTTVYRTLQRLVDTGKVDVTRLPSGEQLFRRCGREQHHHHLVCRECGAAIEVLGPAVERWAEQVATQHGYVDLSHTLEIFGTCSHCAA